MIRQAAGVSDRKAPLDGAPERVAGLATMPKPTPHQ